MPFSTRKSWLSLILNWIKITSGEVEWLLKICVEHKPKSRTNISNFQFTLRQFSVIQIWWESHMGPTKKTSEPSSFAGDRLYNISLTLAWRLNWFASRSKKFQQDQHKSILKSCWRGKMWGQLGIVSIQPVVTELDGSYLIISVYLETKNIPHNKCLSKIKSLSLAKCWHNLIK